MSRPKQGDAAAPLRLLPAGEVGRAAWCVRVARLADLPGLHSWLPPGAATALPIGGDEMWLVAQRPVRDAPTGGDVTRDEVARGDLVAALRLRRAIGLELPRHWYHVGCVVHAAPQLHLFQRRDTLLLGSDHTGASELADLCCDNASLEPLERALVVRLLLRAAMLVVASRRSAFGGRLIAELPGSRDAHGQSAFWLGLGRHFYAGDPVLAEACHGAAWRSHLAPLLPRQPVYTAFLPESARAVIAQVGAEARPLADALTELGLAQGQHVRIDDAGPVLEADIDVLLASQGARRSPVIELPAPAALPTAGRRAAAATGRRWLVLDEGAGGPVVWLRRAGAAQPSEVAAAATAWVADFGA